METPSPSKPGSENLTEQIGRSLQQQRDRVSEFVASQRRRVDSVEARLSEKIETLLDHLDKDRRDAEAASRQIEQQAQHTSREKETLEQLRKTLNEQQQQWQTFQQQTQGQQEQLIEQARCQGEELQERLQQLLKREPEIQTAEQKLRDQQHALELARQEHEAQRRQSAALKETLETERAELQSQREQLDTERDKIRDKRQRIAHALKQQRNEQLEEINCQREDLARRESVQLEDFRAQIEAATSSDGEATLRNIKQQSEHIARERETIERLNETLDEQQQQLKTIRKEIGDQQEQFLGQLQGRQDGLDARPQQVDQREPEIRAVGEKLRKERKALELARQKQDAKLQQMATLKEQLQADQAELQSQREQLAAAQSKTDSQRRHIARTLKQQKGSQLKEIYRRREELANQRDAELGELRYRLEAAASEQGLADKLRAELEAAEGREAELAAEIEELKTAASSRPNDGHEDAPSEHDEELHRRHEMAMEDLRELRAANAELQQQLSDARAGKQETTVAAPGGTLDWEAEKQRILNTLEHESGDVDEQRAADQLEIEGVIQMTDKTLAEKDREIADLKLLLESQSDNIGSVAVGAAALGEMLDSDPIICEERENLKRLQETWRKKLSQAEIEISTERAKLAREKLEIEEKVRLLEKSLSQQSGQPQENEGAGQPTQRRWLTRLGLANDLPSDKKK